MDWTGKWRAYVQDVNDGVSLSLADGAVFDTIGEAVAVCKAHYDAHPDESEYQVSTRLGPSRYLDVHMSFVPDEEE